MLLARVLIPPSPSMDLRDLNEEESAGGVLFREAVGAGFWIANQTRPDIANTVRAVARYFHDPKISY